jgi:hypothetical protein
MLTWNLVYVEVDDMAAFEWFLLGLMVSWVPSLVFLGCIALGSAPEDHRKQPNLQINPHQQNA